MTRKESDWTFFSNYGHVYFLIALENELTTREIAARVQITERAVATILSELVDGGYIDKIKIGRSNTYKVVPGKTLRHDLEDKVELNSLIEIFKKHYQ